MIYYILKNTDEATQWKCGVTDAEGKRAGLTEKGKTFMFEFMNLNAPIHMTLWFQDYGNPGMRNIGFTDIHSWTGNIMLDPPLNGKPVGLHIIISKRVADVLATFQLPTHHFYPAEVEKIDDQEKREYVIFQILYEKYEELYYPEVTFVTVKKNQVLQEIEPGLIKDYNDYLERRDFELNRDSRVILTTKNIIYRKYYDVVWGERGELLLSGKIKQALEKMNFTGVFFEPYEEEIFFKGIVLENEM